MALEIYHANMAIQLWHYVSLHLFYYIKYNTRELSSIIMYTTYVILKIKQEIVCSFLLIKQYSVLKFAKNLFKLAIPKLMLDKNF